MSSWTAYFPLSHISNPLLCLIHFYVHLYKLKWFQLVCSCSHLYQSHQYVVTIIYETSSMRFCIMCLLSHDKGSLIMPIWNQSCLVRLFHISIDIIPAQLVCTEMPCIKGMHHVSFLSFCKCFPLFKLNFQWIVSQ